MRHPLAAPGELGLGSDPGFVGSEAVWGPFPWRGWRLVAGLGLSVMGLLLFVFGLLRHTVVCARVGPLAGQCEWSGVGSNGPHRFPIAALQGLSVRYSETRNKGHVSYHGRIVLPVAGQQRALKSESRESADRNAAALRAFISDPKALKVAIGTERPFAMFLIGGLMALMGLSFLYAVAVGRKRFRFTWDSPTTHLIVRAEWPLGLGKTSTSVYLRSPVDVAIRWGRVEDFWTSTRSPGPPGGWLQVRLADGSAIDLSPSALGLGKGQAQPGYRVHIRAAEQLRQMLGCARRSPNEEAMVVAAHKEARPQVPPGWQGIGGKVAACWLGACCGSLAGIAVSGLLAVGLGFQKMSDSASGTWFTCGALVGVAAGVALSLRLTQHPDER